MFELHKLGIDIEDIGEAVDHVKVDRLLRVATRDPSSALFAARAGWNHPVSREWILFADFVDAFYAANSTRKQKPYPRPWQDNNTNRMGKTTLSPAEAREVLRKNRG